MAVKTIRLVIATMALCAWGTAYAAGPSGLAIGTTKADVTVTIDRAISDGKVLVSVDDAQKKPLLGLGIQDFTVQQGSKKGRVTSVQSVSEVQDVPLNIVMVLDNSYSMSERQAIKPLCDGVDKLLQVVRPIDKVHVIVFDEKHTTKIGNRDLHVQTFTSSNPEKLREFIKSAYTQEQLSGSTYLNDAVLAGVAQIAALPPDNPRILVVFTDGEDINSVVKREECVKAADGAGRFSAYAIDYMPGAAADKDLTSFVDSHHGKIWKAKSEDNLRPIFQQVAATLDYSYILTYAFTPDPLLVVFPEAAFFDFDKAELKAGGQEQLRAYLEQAREQLSRADKIKISGHTDNKGTEEYNMKLSLARAEAVSAYLKSIGVNPDKMQVVGEGMSRPIADNRTEDGRAKNRRVEVEVLGLAK